MYKKRPAAARKIIPLMTGTGCLMKYILKAPRTKWQEPNKFEIRNLKSENEYREAFEFRIYLSRKVVGLDFVFWFFIIPGCWYAAAAPELKTALFPAIKPTHFRSGILKASP